MRDLNAVLGDMPNVKTVVDVRRTVDFLLSQPESSKAIVRAANNQGLLTDGLTQTLERISGAADYACNHRDLFEDFPEVSGPEDVERAIRHLISTRERYPRRDRRKEYQSIGYLVDAAVWIYHINPSLSQHLSRAAWAADYALENIELFEDMPEVRTPADIDAGILYLIKNKEKFPRRDRQDGTMSIGYLARIVKWAFKTDQSVQTRFVGRAGVANYAVSIQEPMERLIAGCYSPSQDRPGTYGFKINLFRRMDSTLFANKRTLKREITQDEFEGLSESIRPFAKRTNNNYQLSLSILDWMNLEREDREFLMENHGVSLLSRRYMTDVRKYVMPCIRG